MNDLDHLENESVFILREAYRRLRPLALLVVAGKGQQRAPLVGAQGVLGADPISMLDQGHTGPITALIRRGLLPREHGDGAPPPPGGTDALTAPIEEPRCGACRSFHNDPASLCTRRVMRVVRA